MRPIVVLFPEMRNRALSLSEEKDKGSRKSIIFGEIVDGVYHLKKSASLEDDHPGGKFENLGDLEWSDGKLKFDLFVNLRFKLLPEDLLSEKGIIDVDNLNKNENQEKIVVIVINDSSIYSRINNPAYPLGIINTKKVAILGAGSGGSLIASYLAKSGVKKLLLVDSDLLMPHNIIRHICSLNDIGRYKTLAVKDYILDRIPNVDIHTIEKDFVMKTKGDMDFFDKMLSDVDLIISATGDHVQNKIVNSFAYERNIPVIYGGTFDKITGGIMLRIDPRKGSACYKCIYNDGNTSREIGRPTVTENVVFYDVTTEDILTQPGLGLDVDLVTLPAVKFILSTLLGENAKDSGTYNFPYDIYYWYNVDMPETQMQSFILYEEPDIIQKIPTCEVCSKKPRVD